MADAADAVAEVTEPATEAAPVEAPVTEAAPEGAPAEATPATAPDLSWVEEFGGLDKVREAAEFRRSATSTEDGAIDAFVEFGVALGLTPAQLASLFPEEAQAIAEAAEEDESELDRPLTRRELEDILNERVLTPLQQQQEQAQIAEMRTHIGTTLDTAKVPAEARAKVLEFADAHVAEADRFDKAKVADGISKGIADYEKWVDSLVEARIAAKSQANETLPTPVAGGSTGGGEAEAEPQTLAEAKARVRERFGRK